MGVDDSGKPRGEGGIDERVVPFRSRLRSEPDVADAAIDPGFDVEAYCREEIALALQQSVPVTPLPPFADPPLKLDPTAERDRLSLLDERAFLMRFWFKVGKAQRAKILAFKKASGVTDGEITLLWWTDSLDMGGPEARPAPSRLNLVRGFVMLGVFSVLSLMTFSYMILLPAPNITNLLLRFLALGSCIAVLCAAMIIDVRPYLICMRIKREANQARQAAQNSMAG